MIAFTAYPDADAAEDMPPNETAVFKNAVLNIGDAYNPNSGEFVAPVHGIYHFSLNIRPRDPSVRWEVYIK